MANLPAELVAMIVYRVTTMVLGLLVIYMGYRLFMAGLFEKAGALKAAWGENRLIIKQGAPGTFFSVLGAVIIVASLLKGFSVTPGGGQGVSVVGSGPIDLAPSKQERRMLDIARMAIEAKQVTRAQRDSFLVWYSAKTAPFDTSRGFKPVMIR